MNLYLLRHCESESGERDDPTRPLTAHGEKQAKVIGQFLHRVVGHIDLILTSYFKRSTQTAAIVAKAIGCETISETAALTPDWDEDDALKEIEFLAGDSTDVLVVSHHPLINDLAHRLCGVSTAEDQFKHGHLMHIDNATGLLHWFVGPKLVERDEKEKKVIEAALGVVVALEAPRSKRKVEVSAFATIQPSGEPADPVDVSEGDDLYLAKTEQPGAGTVSRDITGALVAMAAAAVKAGETASIDAQMYEKRWVLGDGGVSGNCQDCEDNADDGWIPADEEFSAGADEPPMHPNCDCSIETRLMEGD